MISLRSNGVDGSSTAKELLGDGVCGISLVEDKNRFPGMISVPNTCFCGTGLLFSRFALALFAFGGGLIALLVVPVGFVAPN